MECDLLKVKAKKNNQTLFDELFIAKTVWQRTRGLLGRKPLSESQALLIEKCNSIHMIGMKYPIDLCYLDNKCVVVKVVSNIKPWQFSACRKANAVIEMQSGMLEKLNITEGDSINWSE